MLSLLLRARDEDGRPMSDAELRDELMTLLLAGHETTATSLAFAFDLLPRHPEVLGRLRDELASGDDDYLERGRDRDDAASARSSTPPSGR